MRRMLPPLLVLLTAAPAAGDQYRLFEPHEVVHRADLVCEATVLRIIPPGDLTKSKGYGVSVAEIKILHVLKGDLRKGAVTRFVYSSHQPADSVRSLKPDKFEAGETLVLALAKNSRNLGSYAAPSEAAEAPWEWRFRRVVNGPDMQTPEFRAVASMWRAPEKHLDDPKRRRDAIYFLAAQRRLPDPILIGLLSAEAQELQEFGVEIADMVKSRAAVVPLALRVEGFAREIASWKGGEIEFEEQQRRLRVRHRCLEAQVTLARLPLDGTKDAELLTRLALCGGVSDELVAPVLRALPARWEVTKALRERLRPGTPVEAVKVLAMLDARAGYPVVQKAAAPPPGGAPTAEAARLVNAYHTTWAKRYVLEHTSAVANPSDEPAAYSYVSGSFGFVHEPLDPDARLKKAGKKGGWAALYAELRVAAREQLALAEKLGLSFAELPRQLAGDGPWQLAAVGGGSCVILTPAQRRELTKHLVRYADSNAAGLDARAPAAWVVDLHAPRSQSLPLGQLWVAADGTFGFGWLPDRAWGRSEEVAALLKRWSAAKSAGP